MSVYYLDCEFNSFGGDLISIALVREDGKAISLVVGCDDPHPWVAENVMPILFSDPHSRKVAKADIPNELLAFFRGDPQPHIISDWPDDIKYFCECLVPSPGYMIAIPGVICQVVRVNAYPSNLDGAIQHNAYWDAAALRHMFV